MTVGFFGTILNQFLKILCCVPRPWVKDPGFTIVESARAEATGYSFPSGHTQNAVATYGGIARYTRRRWLRGVCIALTLVICFSRMYLGVHTPLDVGVSFVIAAALVLLVYPLMEEADRRPRVLTAMIGVMVLCSAAFIVYLYLRGDTGTTAEDTANYVSALQNAWKLTGPLRWECWRPTFWTGGTSASRRRRCGGPRSSSWWWASDCCLPSGRG